MKDHLYLIAFFLIGCGTGEPVSGRTNHIYKNATPYAVEVFGYNNDEVAERFKLATGEEFIREIPAVDGDGNGPYSSTLFSPHDSVLVFYADTLVIHFDLGSLEGNPMRIENYDLVEAEREPFIYEFVFDEEDYNLALERGRIVE